MYPALSKEDAERLACFNVSKIRLDGRPLLIHADLHDGKGCHVVAVVYMNVIPPEAQLEVMKVEDHIFSLPFTQKKATKRHGESHSTNVQHLGCSRLYNDTTGARRKVSYRFAKEKKFGDARFIYYARHHLIVADRIARQHFGDIVTDMESNIGASNTIGGTPFNGLAYNLAPKVGHSCCHPHCDKSDRFCALSPWGNLEGDCQRWVFHLIDLGISLRGIGPRDMIVFRSDAIAHAVTASVRRSSVVMYTDKWINSVEPPVNAHTFNYSKHPVSEWESLELEGKPFDL
jgi:hypothetical protein